MNNNQNCSPAKTVIVIVLYKEKLRTSETYKSLIASCQKNQLGHQLDLFIYDNSPEPDHENHEASPFSSVKYIHNSENPGLANAYNEAFRYGVSRQSQWLVLFDQDSQLTEDYLEEVLQHTKEAGHCVLVPQITQNGKTLSPNIKGQPVLEGEYVGKEIEAINSGTVVSLSVINQIQGFNNEFPLDYLDHWFFWKVNQAEITIVVLKARLSHSLSVNNLNTVSEQRLLSILRAEKKFIMTYRPNKKLSYYTHYLMRMLKYLIKDPVKLKVGWKVLTER